MGSKSHRHSKNKFARKDLGQNFLNSPEIREKILDFAGNIKDKNVLEIGPGLGFLTTKLLQSKAQVTAVEMDMRAIEILQRDFGNKSNFKCLPGDILKQDFRALFGAKPFCIIANIPYNITAPIFRKCFAEESAKPEFAVLMVQKEVGEKVCTQKINPHGRVTDCKNFKRSILSLSVEIFAETVYGFTVDRNCFSPVPKVDSAVIKLIKRPSPLVETALQKDFFTIINAGFSQKRKKLSNLLGAFFGLKTERLLDTIDPNRRAETLTVEEWIHITKNFQRHKKALSSQI